MRTFFFVLTIGFLASCSATKRTSAIEKGPAALMVGSFSSAAQAAADTNYYAVTLHMYPIWESTSEPGITYLYVEQALARMPERPYRQRVYRVAQEADGRWGSAVYKLPDEKAYIGKWSDASFFDRLTPDELIEREGCTVFLEAQGSGNWAGSTHEADCGSTMRGATYATSRVTVSRDRIESWDQGFDAAGEQVWGAELGAYVFLRG